MTMMTPKELKLAAAFMREFADRLGSDGCDDWEWPGTWTEDERMAFAEKMNAVTIGEMPLEYLYRKGNSFGPGASAMAIELARLLERQANHAQ